MIFGEAKIEDLSAARGPAQQFSSGRCPPWRRPKAKIEEEDEGEVDEPGVEPKDIELDVGRACPAAKPTNALKGNDGDIAPPSWTSPRPAVGGRSRGRSGGGRVCVAASARDARAFSRFPHQQINATATHKIRKDSPRASLPLLLRARFTSRRLRRDDTAACAIRRQALVHTTPLALLFRLGGFAARVASSAAMASCATLDNDTDGERERTRSAHVTGDGYEHAPRAVRALCSANAWTR